MQHSIVRYENEVLNSIDFRLDAEFYKPEYLKEDKLKRKYKQIILGDIAFITDGQHGYHEVDEMSNISHITAKNTKNWFADKIAADKIAKWVDDKNQRSSLIVNDVLLSTRGSVGYTAIVKENVLPANIDQDIARIALNDKKIILPEYLLSFLNCKYGQDWVTRNSSGMVQQGLSLAKVRLIPIPVLNYKLQKIFKNLIDKAFNFFNNSKLYYQHAETLLLQELNLENWKPKHKLWNVKKYSDTEEAGRIDAEYYQPKYDEIIDAVKNYKGGWDKLGEIINIKDKNFMPDDENVYKYIELANISNNGEVTGHKEEKGKILPTRARRIVNTGDLIISSIEGSLDSVALITEKYNEALCSNGFYVVNSDYLNSETLLCLMKVCIGNQQLKKGCSGTILTAINKDEFSKIILPKINEPIQKEIKNKISDVYKFKYQSKQLLEIAKTGVEKAIEENEEVAIAWINEELEKLGVEL